MNIRRATEHDDPLLVEHYLAIWDSYGVPKAQLLADAQAPVLAFIAEGRANRKLAAFIAEEDRGPAGSAACLLHVSPFPEVIAPEHRLFGYIYHVYVAEEFRRRGLARKLAEQCIAHLRAIGCTHVVLHSSDAGERLYESLGFKLAREMRLPLKE